LYEALHDARWRQRTPEFRARYHARAGIAGTFSQGVSIGDLRRTRYCGLAKTRLLHLLIATALNFHRVAAWLAERPRAQTCPGGVTFPAHQGLQLRFASNISLIGDYNTYLRAPERVTGSAETRRWGSRSPP